MYVTVNDVVQNTLKVATVNIRLQYIHTHLDYFRVVGRHGRNPFFLCVIINWKNVLLGVQINRYCMTLLTDVSLCNWGLHLSTMSLCEC